MMQATSHSFDILNFVTFHSSVVIRLAPWNRSALQSRTLSLKKTETPEKTGLLREASVTSPDTSGQAWTAHAPTRMRLLSLTFLYGVWRRRSQQIETGAAYCFRGQALHGTQWEMILLTVGIASGIILVQQLCTDVAATVTGIMREISLDKEIKRVSHIPAERLDI